MENGKKPYTELSLMGILQFCVSSNYNALSYICEVVTETAIELNSDEISGICLS